MGGALLEPGGVRLQRDNSTNLTHPWTSLTKQNKKEAAHQSVLGKLMPFRPYSRGTQFAFCLDT